MPVKEISTGMNGTSAEISLEPVAAARGDESVRHLKYVAGDVIMTSYPWTYTILPELMEKVCYRCLSVLELENTQAEDCLTCPSCCIPVYCSKKCRSADWEEPEAKNGAHELFDSSYYKQSSCPVSGDSPIVREAFKRPGRHQIECSSLLKGEFSRSGTMTLTADFFLLLGAVKKLASKQAGDDFDRCFPDTGRDFHSLLNHSEEIAAMDDRMVYVSELMAKLALCLTPAEMPDAALFLDIFGCLQVNSFGIRSPFLVGVGEGLYFGPSVFDHSCDRNTVFLFDGIRIVMKAVADIPSFHQVRISYTDLFVPSSVRQRRCLFWWHFSCQCCFCADERTLAEIYSIKCLTADCDAALPLDDRAVLPCVACLQSTVTKESLSDTRILIRRCLEGVEEMDDRMKLPEWDIDDITTEFRIIQRRCVEILHPTNCLLGMVSDRLARLAVVADDYSDAARYFRLSLPALRTRTIFKPCDTQVAVQTLMAGLTSFLAEDHVSAAVFLQEASSVLKICDGPDRPLFGMSLILYSASRDRIDRCSDSSVDSNDVRLLARSLQALLANVRIGNTFIELHQVIRQCTERIRLTKHYNKI